MDIDYDEKRIWEKLIGHRVLVILYPAMMEVGEITVKEVSPSANYVLASINRTSNPIYPDVVVSERWLTRYNRKIVEVLD